jgi:hypothetical protein
MRCLDNQGKIAWKRYYRHANEIGQRERRHRENITGLRNQRSTVVEPFQQATVSCLRPCFMKPPSG